VASKLLTEEQKEKLRKAKKVYKEYEFPLAPLNLAKKVEIEIPLAKLKLAKKTETEKEEE